MPYLKIASENIDDEEKEQIAIALTDAVNVLFLTRSPG